MREFTRHRPRLFRIAYRRILGSHADSEDVQDAYLRRLWPRWLGCISTGSAQCASKGNTMCAPGVPTPLIGETAPTADSSAELLQLLQRAPEPSMFAGDSFAPSNCFPQKM
jgi:hypothetical protein